MNSTTATNTIVTRSGAQKAKIQTRSMVKAKTSVDIRKPNPALVEAKRKAKLKMEKSKTTSSAEEISVKDIFQNALNAANLIRGETGVIYDESMKQHKCLWDVHHPERPERFTRIIERCTTLKLLERCKRIPSRKATKEEILLRHSEGHYNLLKSTSGVTDEEKLEELASRYDCVYFHPSTFDLSLLATGCTIDLVTNIVTGTLQNGMAIIRPPGHHAMKAEFNGYCFFNNVAIAAQYALDKLNLKRILIVDWDIHHGQGTQRYFYNDPRVLYFSIHRFEHGTFWPHLRESDFDYIGEGAGKGYNFNVPLNAMGLGNEDYNAIFQQILIPVGIEFQPELVIISSGFDAALGCPEGEMEVHPQFYPHLLNPLLSLAQGRVAVILEGGYCLESLSEGAALTLRTLLGDPCPKIGYLPSPSATAQESILNCIYTHRAYWKCLQTQKTYTLEELNNINPQPNLHKVIQIFKGGPPIPEKYDTRNCFPIQSPELVKSLEERLLKLKLTTNLSFPETKVCYVYDEFMLEHRNIFEENHPEHPDRMKRIKERHEDYKLFERMEKVSSRNATIDEICLAHSRAYVNLIRKSVEKQELKEIGDSYNSVYFHPKTFECATMAAGSVLEVVDHVLNGNVRSGVCIVRPPGHHAESDLPHGFCIFNNVAVAAQYAVQDHGLKRVLIVDWDVHHGNGTQHIFESNKQVLYISIHRYDGGSFFPKGKDGDYIVVGKDEGEGFNVNIPWNKKGMGDAEYALAFQRVIMPIAYEFNPELVLISAGFDAVIGDPLGGCKVTPEAYGHFTHWLSSLANGKVIVCLEGGYNVNSISYAMTMCTKALLGDPLPSLCFNTKPAILSSCIETIQNVLETQSKYWKSLRFHKKLPESRIGNEMELSDLMMNLKMTQHADNKKTGDKNAASSSSTPSGTSMDSEPKPGPSKPKGKTLQQLLLENNELSGSEEVFAVVPLKNCPHLSLLKPEDAPTQIDTKAPCHQCQSTIENWICLHCFDTLCGRYISEHMQIHYNETEHPLVLGLTDLSVWCYPCESYVDNSRLHLYKNLAHMDKFGEELPWSYSEESIQSVREEVGSWGALD